MRRYLAESVVLIAASVIVVVLGTVALGNVAMRETASVPELPLAMTPGCFDAPVVPVDDSGIGGEAKLCVVDDAVRPALRVANLTPDTVYLALFEYFELPSACQSFPCGSADHRGDGSGGVLARIDATVANGTRRADFWGDIRDLPLTRRSQVTLTLFDRGSVRGSDGRRRAHQLLALPITPSEGVPNDHRAGQRVAQAIFLPATEVRPDPIYWDLLPDQKRDAIPLRPERAPS
jgi:hypothetical protein